MTAARNATSRFPEASYVAGLAGNPEYKVDRLRINYQSMVTPSTVYDYHLADGRLEVLKVREIPSGYDASQYATERLMAPARDGTLDSGIGGLSQGLQEGRLRPPAHLCLWRLWPRRAARLLRQPAVAARSRLCLRHRPYPRRRRSRLPVVSRRQARQAHQHLQRLRRRDALHDRAGLCVPGPRHGGGRLRRRRIDGRDRQSGARTCTARSPRMCRSSTC